jgi:hypothetical protein
VFALHAGAMFVRFMPTLELFLREQVSTRLIREQSQRLSKFDLAISNAADDLA